MVTDFYALSDLIIEVELLKISVIVRFYGLYDAMFYCNTKSFIPMPANSKKSALRKKTKALRRKSKALRSLCLYFSSAKKCASLSLSCFYCYFCNSKKIKAMKKINTVVFDLDGTLLDTLTDLMNSVNVALRKYDLPERSYQEIRSFVGNGVRLLVERAVPAQTKEELTDSVFSSFKQHYMEHCKDTTKPYAGIIPLLKDLKEKGYKLSIVSNKLQGAVSELNEQFFSAFVDVAIGESENVRRKPAPDSVFRALELLGSSKDEAVYVGDSDVDVATARAAGLQCLSVLWGFRDEHLLRKCGAENFVSAPQEVIDFISVL